MTPGWRQGDVTAQPAGGGAHSWPIFLLTHRAPALHWGPGHAGEGSFVALRMPRGTWVSLDARVPISVPRTRDQVSLPRPAGSGSSHTGPKCWSQTGALSSQEKCLPESVWPLPLQQAYPSSSPGKTDSKVFKYFMSLFLSDFFLSQSL